jgi:putative serine protease PepD
MGFDEEGDDERPATGPLPPDDRLWRHPSELGGEAAPEPSPWSQRPQQPRRALVLAAMASACLTGAVTAIALAWLTSPAEVATAPTPVGEEPAARFGEPTLWAEHLRAAGASLALVEAGTPDEERSGTGVWVDDDGTLLVPRQLIEGSLTVAVIDHEGRRRRGAVVALDHATGVAIVRAPGAPTTPLRAEATERARPGAPVALAGSTMPPDGPGALVRTTVRATDRRTEVDGHVLHATMVLERPVAPELVGAAVLDVDGKAVAIVLEPAHHDGPAVAVPADHALQAALDLRVDGQVRRPWLGVRAADAPAESDEPSGGALVMRVSAGSPAASAGLRSGDVVVRVDDHDVADASDLVMALRSCEPGQRVTVHLRRGGEPIVVEAQLAG